MLRRIGLVNSDRVGRTVIPAELIRRSAHWWSVLDAALVPKRVQATGDLERRALPDIPFEHFAVIADIRDNTHDPVLGQAELLAVIAFGADQALDFWIVGFDRV